MSFSIYVIIFLIMIMTLNTKYHIHFKTLTSLAFLTTAIYAGITSQHTVQLYALLPGLIGCLAGDFLLATKNKKSFLYGLTAFLIANTCYVIYFFNYAPLTVIELIVPVSSIIMLISLSHLPKMDYRNYYKPICAYTFMISWAMSRSVVTYIAFPTESFLVIMLGFMLYYFSDFILLFDRFYEHNLKILRYVNLITYYLGMFLIAYSLF